MGDDNDDEPVKQTMYLHASTDCINSGCSVDMGITPDEWDKLNFEERQTFIREFKSNVVDLWVEQGNVEG